MTGVLRRIGGGAWALAAACGPTYVDGPFGAGSGSSDGDGGGTAPTASASGSASMSATASATATLTATDTATLTATDTATLTATDTATLTATDTATATVTETLDSSGEDVPVDAISTVDCQGEFVGQVYVLAPIDGCVPPADLDPSNVLFVGIEAWSGEAGVFAVDNQTAMAAYDLEPVTGTITLEVTAPYRPSWLDYELMGTSTKLSGSVDLEPCSYVEEPPCGGTTTSG